MSPGEAFSTAPAGSFLPREYRDGFVDILPGEEKGPQKIAFVLGREVFSLGEHLLPDGVLIVQIVDALLGEEAAEHLMAEGDAPRGGFLLAAQKAAEGGFSRPVYPHQGYPLPPGDREGELFENLFAAVALIHLLKGEHLVTAPGAFGKGEMHRSPLALCGEKLFPLQHFDAALHLGGLGGLVPKAFDKVLRLLSQGLLLLGPFFEEPFILFLLLQIVRIVSLILPKLSSGDLQVRVVILSRKRLSWETAIKVPR